MTASTARWTKETYSAFDAAVDAVFAKDSDVEPLRTFIDENKHLAVPSIALATVIGWMAAMNRFMEGMNERNAERNTRIAELEQRIATLEAAAGVTSPTIDEAAAAKRLEAMFAPEL
jgi:hypothetical protein